MESLGDLFYHQMGQLLGTPSYVKTRMRDYGIDVAKIDFPLTDGSFGAEHERENLLLARIRDAGIDVKDGHFETMITFMMGPLAFGEDCGLKGFNIQNYDGRPALEGLVPNGDGGFRFVGDDGKETENLGRTRRAVVDLIEAVFEDLISKGQTRSV